MKQHPLVLVPYVCQKENFFTAIIKNEPAHDKTSNRTFATSEDSDQPAHPRSLIRVFADHMCLLQPTGYPKRGKREALPYWVDVQADLSLCWSNRSYCRFCRALDQSQMYSQLPSCSQQQVDDVTKTCLYNFDPLKSHFYIVKLEFTGVCIIFLISDQKHRLWLLVRTASPRRFYRVPTIYVLSRNVKKKSEFLILKYSFFGGKIFSILE